MLTIYIPPGCYPGLEDKRLSALEDSIYGLNDDTYRLDDGSYGLDDNIYKEKAPLSDYVL